jgi:hypothetical protein
MIAELQAALAPVRASGYVALKEKSYRAAQNRQRIAEREKEYAESIAASSDRWARESLAEERRIRDRLTFVWGIATAHGATVEELGGNTGLADSDAPWLRRTVASPCAPLPCHADVLLAIANGEQS